MYHNNIQRTQEQFHLRHVHRKIQSKLYNATEKFLAQLHAIQHVAVVFHVD